VKQENPHKGEGKRGESYSTKKKSRERVKAGARQREIETVRKVFQKEKKGRGV